MAAIYGEFSERNLSDVLADALDEDRHVVFAEALESYELLGGSVAALDMRRLLAARGWDLQDGDEPAGDHESED